jgi:hypothetical protein
MEFNPASLFLATVIAPLAATCPLCLKLCLNLTF